MLRSNYVYALLYAVLSQACCKQYFSSKNGMGSSLSSFSNTATNKDDSHEKNVINKQSEESLINKQAEEMLRFCKSNGLYQDNENVDKLFKIQMAQYGINFKKQNTEEIKK